MDTLQIPGYELVHKVGTSKQMGGVTVIATPKISCEKLENAPLPKSPKDAGSCLLYPTQTEKNQIRVTGLYVPPPAEATPDMLIVLAPSAGLSKEGGRHNLTHLVGGDLNPNSWSRRDRNLYHEWIHETGTWGLSHPEQSTYKTGTVLEKFLLVQGDFVSDEWLSPYNADDNIRGNHIIDLDIEHYPARTFPDPRIDDHHPVMLSMGGEGNRPSPE